MMRFCILVCLSVLASSHRLDVHSVVEGASKVAAKYNPKSVQDAWDNHFAAFGDQDLDKIMLDYDDNSVARLFNNVDGSKSEFHGLAEIRAMFSTLFSQLTDLKTLEAPVADVDEEGRQVFLVWKCPGMGYETATDTFLFTDEFKVSRQNIVVTKQAVSDALLQTATKAATKYNPQSVQDAWDNHFAAFGDQDLDKIMLDYDDNSVARLFNNVDGSKSEFHGLAEIRAMFSTLFSQLKDLKTLEAPVVDVDEEGRQVFLIWKCPGMGYETATDTFLFTDEFKVSRQNIVVTKQ